jgi:leucyl-tRNA synthetase
MLAPFTPFLCEEIWEKMGKQSFLSLGEWPIYEESKISLVAEEIEEMIKSTLEDTMKIIKVTKIKSNRICYYLSSEWKWKTYLRILELGELSLGEIIKEVMHDPNMRRKEIQDFIKRIYSDVIKLSPEIKQKKLKVSKADQDESFYNAMTFFEKQIGAKVEVYDEDDPKKYDPKNRSQSTNPYRLAIYIE